MRRRRRGRSRTSTTAASTTTPARRGRAPASSTGRSRRLGRRLDSEGGRRARGRSTAAGATTRSHARRRGRHGGLRRGRGLRGQRSARRPGGRLRASDRPAGGAGVQVTCRHGTARVLARRIAVARTSWARPTRMLYRSRSAASRSPCAVDRRFAGWPKLSADEAAAFQVELQGSARRVSLARAYDVILARGLLPAGTGNAAVKLKPKRRPGRMRAPVQRAGGHRDGCQATGRPLRGR